MRTCSIFLFSCSVLLSISIGCQKSDIENSEDAKRKVNELRTYDNLTENANLLLGIPVGLKYDDEAQHLFVQDIARSGIIEINDSSNVINVYGREGSGPGEIQELSDFFVTKNHLYIVDSGQYLIHKYNRLDGQYISSLDYGQFLLDEKSTSENGIPPPPKPVLIDNNNEPFVTLNETILIPSQANGKFLYQAMNWNGDKLADIGEILDECTVVEENDSIRSALENRNVPARDLCLAFPVNDRSNPEEIFLVYSAIPKIAKYSLSGGKIWEHRISSTPEVDSLMIDLSNVVKSRPDSPGTLMLPVRKYITGRTSPDGDLYLITYTNLQIPNSHRSMWIHQFDSEGKLDRRYKVVSNVDVWYYPGIDFKERRMFVPLVQDAGIRIYNF